MSIENVQAATAELAAANKAVLAAEETVAAANGELGKARERQIAARAALDAAIATAVDPNPPAA